MPIGRDNAYMSVGMTPLLGAIEAGGTKFVLAVGPTPDEVLASHTIPTGSPQETLEAAAAWLEQHGAIAALGIASFGPADLQTGSPTWGHITDTPKPGWSGCNLAGFFAQRFGVPICFETDVNAAALAEFAAADLDAGSTLVYVTVGTGIGGGLIIDGKAVHGAAHPEMGHIFPRREPSDSDFPGTCPFHGDCLEGLASGPAIIARWGASLSNLEPDHEAHMIVAGYLAQLCHTIFATTAAEVIVFGGGVMKAPGLLDRVRRLAAQIDAAYLPGRKRQVIRAPRLGSEAGVRGALLLAANSLAAGS
jgi:fructokinase